MHAADLRAHQREIESGDPIRAARAEPKIAAIYVVEPERDAAVAVCLRAWADLSTCRGIGMAAGPIPWTAIVQWCRWHRLDRDNARLVVTVIRQLDIDRAAAEEARRAFEAARGSANQPPSAARSRR